MKRPRIIYTRDDGTTAVYGTVRKGTDPLTAVGIARVKLARNHLLSNAVIRSVRIEHAREEN